MGQFRTLAPDDVRSILASFDVPAYRTHHPIEAGTINTNVRVETAGGPYFLRVNEGKTADDVAREAAIVLHVVAAGVPSPAPRRSHGGTPFAVWGGHFVSLFPWVDGHLLQRRALLPEHAGQVGRALAKMHGASDSFPDRRPGRYEPAEIRQRLVGLRELVAAGRADTAIAEAVSILGPELEALDSGRERVLPTGIIHGDLFVDNVLFGSGGDLVAFLDFEQASWGRLAYDMAVTTLAFGYGTEDFRPEIVRALIDGYTAVRRPSSAEIRGFGAELRFAACRFAVTRITDVYLRRDQGVPRGKDFRRYIARLESVRRHLAAQDGLFDLSGEEG